MKHANLETVIIELESLIQNFRCWADDSDACDAMQSAISAHESAKLALKSGVDTEFACRKALRAIDMLKEYAA